MLALYGFARSEINVPAVARAYSAIHFHGVGGSLGARESGSLRAPESGSLGTGLERRKMTPTET